ncbi:MAG TPA: lytic transglycosylase domain-containing protein [Candidatus Limnocylindrales bacterium]|nr:lytic transglycosylase domain-containing protein [Candidatus Limnocylindrales bacterium]
MARHSRLGAVAALGAVIGLGACSGSGATPDAVASPSAPSVVRSTASPSVAPSPAASPAPADPVADLATHLRVLESRIRATQTRYTQLPALAQNQQAAYQQLILHPQWLPAVLDALPQDLRDVVLANVTAAQQIRELNGLRSGLPHWRIVAPPEPDLLLAYYHEAQARYGIPWEYLAAINLIETSMGRIQGTSVAGALGPMQFMPATWAHYGQGGDVNNPHDAILAAARYLRAHGGPGDMPDAVFAYNPSDLYVRAVTLYVGVMQADSRAFFGYYFWQVYVPTTSGDVLLPQGFSN